MAKTGYQLAKEKGWRIQHHTERLSRVLWRKPAYAVQIYFTHPEKGHHLITTRHARNLFDALHWHIKLYVAVREHCPEVPE